MDRVVCGRQVLPSLLSPPLLAAVHLWLCNFHWMRVHQDAGAVPLEVRSCALCALALSPVAAQPQKFRVPAPRARPTLPCERRG